MSRNSKFFWFEKQTRAEVGMVEVSVYVGAGAVRTLILSPTEALQLADELTKRANEANHQRLAGATLAGAKSHAEERRRTQMLAERLCPEYTVPADDESR